MTGGAGTHFTCFTGTKVHILTLLLTEGFFRKENVSGATREGWLAGGTEKERTGWGGRGEEEEEREQEVNQVTTVARDERVTGGTEEDWEEEEVFSS